MARKVKVKIHELANQKGISLRELSRLTERIADTLELNDIREIIDLIKVKDK